MTLEVQFKLKSNPNFLNYLHDNSYLYKILNRNPNKINDFIEEVKDKYHLRTSDKISRALETFDMLSSVLQTLK